MRHSHLLRRKYLSQNMSRRKSIPLPLPLGSPFSRAFKISHTRTNKSPTWYVTVKAPDDSPLTLSSQMQGLSTRVGAHGFFCLVRASANYNTSPKWYYTHEGIDDYLKFIVRRRWDPRLIGTQLEAFAIAGCDVNSRFIVWPSCPSL